MTFWVVVPVKPLELGKSRLSMIFNTEERIAINHSMLTNTLNILSHINYIDQVLVISQDDTVGKIAKDFGVMHVQENGVSGLNCALEHGSSIALEHNATSVMIIPTDLPLVTGPDLSSLIEAQDRSPMMVIVPDTKMDGTNALIISPVKAISYQFGEHSFQKHLSFARNNQIPVKIIKQERIGLDLDLPVDLEIIKTIDNDLIYQLLQGGLHG
jgi:2-phospho-L-lactate guanylyltransferase